MKKILTSIIVLLTVLGSSYAQDMRQRKPETIVQDVVALMPMQFSSELNAEIRPLAEGAPETVAILASMMKPSDSGANDKVEFAFNALMQYASDPANASVLPGVKEGLKSAAAAAGDPYLKAFYEALLRLVAYDEAAPVVQPATASDPSVPVYKARKFAKMKPAQKCDAMYRIGEARDASQLPLVLSEIEAADSETFRDAAVAASKIGGEDAAYALVAALSDSDPAIADVAYEALLAFNGIVNPAITAALDEGCTPRLLDLAGTRCVKASAPQVFAALSSEDEAVSAAAVKALKGVVTSSDIDRVAVLYDKAEKNQEDYLAAFRATLSDFSVTDKFSIARSRMEMASNPGRFLPVIAETGTDEAAEVIVGKLDGPCHKEAVDALAVINNVKAAPAMLECADENEWLLARFVEVIDANTWEPLKFAEFRKALDIADKGASTDVRKCLIELVSAVPSLESIDRLLPYLEDPELDWYAAEAIRLETGRIADRIDRSDMERVFGKAKTVYAKYKAKGWADAGYAIDELDKMLADAEVFTNALTPDEEAQGFELLFDGKDMSKWQGALDGYFPVNGTINVATYFGDNLYTKKEYRDFVYRFEFRFLVPAVNNGVGIRTPMGVDAAYMGMCELQILDHDDPVYDWLQPYQVHGSIYGVVPAKRIVHKPLGEWSSEEIVVKGDHIKVTVNGEVIVDADIREACQGHNVSPDGGPNPYTVDHNDHPGMFNEKGYISFCGHGTGLQFKNIRILDLSE